jgi:aspartate/methionine/tyrosine aminotransferase
MAGFFANGDLTPNRIEQARSAAHGTYVDLTSSNPTQHGLFFPHEVLEHAAAGYWRQRRYEPHPQGSPHARLAIVNYYAHRKPCLQLAIEDVFITASTSEAYSLLFGLLTEPGDNVLVPVASYPLFEFLAELHHIELRPYALDEARGWRIDPASLHAQADRRTRAVLIVSPNNPTGAILAYAVPALATLGLPLIADEVFAPFTYHASHTPPIGALHPELPVFHLNGISKMFALPDLKLGWIALNAAARSFAPRLELLNDTFLGSNALTQYMLPTIFEHGSSFVSNMLARLRESLDLAIERLATCQKLTVQSPDGGYYLFPEVHGWDDEEELVLHCLRHGVLVHPGYFYGYEHGAHIMLSCLTEPQQLEAGLERLTQALEHSD